MCLHVPGATVSQKLLRLICSLPFKEDWFENYAPLSREPNLCSIIAAYVKQSCQMSPSPGPVVGHVVGASTRGWDSDVLGHPAVQTCVPRLHKWGCFAHHFPSAPNFPLQGMAVLMRQNDTLGFLQLWSVLQLSQKLNTGFREQRIFPLVREEMFLEGQVRKLLYKSLAWD